MTDVPSGDARDGRDGTLGDRDPAAADQLDLRSLVVWVVIVVVPLGLIVGLGILIDHFVNSVNQATSTETSTTHAEVAGGLLLFVAAVGLLGMALAETCKVVLGRRGAFHRRELSRLLGFELVRELTRTNGRFKNTQLLDAPLELLMARVDDLLQSELDRGAAADVRLLGSVVTAWTRPPPTVEKREAPRGDNANDEQSKMSTEGAEGRWRQVEQALKDLTSGPEWSAGADASARSTGPVAGGGTTSTSVDGAVGSPSTLDATQAAAAILSRFFDSVVETTQFLMSTKWRWRVRLWAIAASTMVASLAVFLTDQEWQSKGAMVALAAVFAGPFAWLARDLFARAERART